MLGGEPCLWFLRLYWIGRFGKVIQFLSAAVVLIEIAGPERVDAAAIRSRDSLPPFDLPALIRRTNATIRTVFARLSNALHKSGETQPTDTLGCAMGCASPMFLAFGIVVAVWLYDQLSHWGAPWLLGLPMVLTLAFFAVGAAAIAFCYVLAVTVAILLLIPRATIAAASGLALFLLRRKRLSEIALFASFYARLPGAGGGSAGLLTTPIGHTRAGKAHARQAPEARKHPGA